MENKDKIILDLCGTQYERKVFYDCKGYPCVYIDGREYKVHVLVWEAAYGSKPSGFEIHHKDFTKINYRLDNLELLTPSEHRRIHAGWVRTSGEWTHKPCSGCNQLLPLTEFYHVKTRNIETALCKDCHNKAITEHNKDGRRREYKRDYYRKHYGKGEFHDGEYRRAYRQAQNSD